MGLPTPTHTHTEPDAPTLCMNAFSMCFHHMRRFARDTIPHSNRYSACKQKPTPRSGTSSRYRCNIEAHVRILIPNQINIEIQIRIRIKIQSPIHIQTHIRFEILIHTKSESKLNVHHMLVHTKVPVLVHMMITSYMKMPCVKSI